MKERLSSMALPIEVSRSCQAGEIEADFSRAKRESGVLNFRYINSQNMILFLPQIPADWLLNVSTSRRRQLQPSFGQVTHKCRHAGRGGGCLRMFHVEHCKSMVWTGRPAEEKPRPQSSRRDGARGRRRK